MEIPWSRIKRRFFCFDVAMNNLLVEFDVTAAQLSKLMKDRDSGGLEILNTQYGGIQKMMHMLKTDEMSGISTKVNFL